MTIEEIEKSIVKLSGALGLAQVAPVVVKSFKESSEKKVILAVNRNSIDLVRAAFELSEAKIKIQVSRPSRRGCGGNFRVR